MTETALPVPTANPDSSASAPPAQTVRLRAILMGLLLSVVICALTPFNNAYLQGTPLGGGHFPLAPFFVLIWLTILMGVLRKIFKARLPLTGRELLVSWILMVLASGIAYTGLVRTFFINLTAPYYFATVENRWRKFSSPCCPTPGIRMMQPRSAIFTTGWQAAVRWAGWRCSLRFPGRRGSLPCWSGAPSSFYAILSCSASSIFSAASPCTRSA